MAVTRGLALSLMAQLAALPALGEPVVVFAASSLQGPLDQAAAEFGAATGDMVTISYAGSAALARQIIAGAPAGLFVSAAPEWMDAVADAGLLVPGERADLLGNRLVIVAPGPVGDVLTPDGLDVALADDGLMAMGHVDSVPAGIYGRAALESLGLWDIAAPHVVQVDNVRVALGLVASGDVALGVVYASDAVTAPALTIAATFPAGSHAPIIYPAGVIAPGTDAAAAFLAYLASPAGRAPFLAAGFLPPP